MSSPVPAAWAERLRHHLDACSGPLVRLWGWPGTGKQRLISELLDEDPARSGGGGEGFGAGPLRWAAVDRNELEELRQPLSGPGSASSDAGGVRWLAPVTRRGRLPEGSGLTPEDFLLSEAEVAEAWRQRTGSAPKASFAEALRRATDGWLIPVILAAEAAREGKEVAAESSLLVRLPAVRVFFEDRVWAPLPSTDRDVLLDLSLEERIDAFFWREAFLGRPARWEGFERLIDDFGLSVGIGEGGRRLPRLLKAFLEDRRRGEWDPDRGPAAHVRLGVIHCALGQGAAAAEHFRAAADGARLARLIESSPWTFVAEMPAAALAPFLAEAGTIRRSRDGVPALRRWLQATLGLVGEGTSSRGGKRAAFERLARRFRDLQELAGPPRVSASAAILELAQIFAGSPPKVEKEPLPAEPSLLDLFLARARALSERPRTTPGTSDPETRRPSEPPPVRFRIALLGPPLVSRETADGERHEVSWTLSRALRVLAYVASSPSLRASKAEIVDALWPDEERAVIQRNFHPTMSHLRKSLGAKENGSSKPLVYAAGGYQLNPSMDWWIDLREYSARIEAGQLCRSSGQLEEAVEHYEKAWKLYRGVYMEDFYDSWVVQRREVLTREHLQSVRELGDIRAVLGRDEGALDAYRYVLMEDPLEEMVQVALMRLYAAQGRRDLVRRQYERLCVMLLEELGVEPLSQTTEEYHRLMGSRE